MNGALYAALLLAFLCVLALAIGVLMLLVFAQIIGWRTLSRAFPAGAGRHAPAPLRTDGVVLGAWGWNAPPLRIALDDDGIWLLPRSIFRIAFRDVRVPWEAILSIGQRRFMLFDVVEVRYGESPKATLGFLSGTAASAVASEAAARGALPLPVAD